MSTEFTSQPKLNLNVETKASRFDQLNALLIACIMLAGFLFAVLFLIWFTSVFDFSRRVAGPIAVVNDPGDSKPEGVADDILEPGVEEFPEIEIPQLANALEAVTDAVSSVRATLEKRSGNAVLQGAGRGYGSREGGPGTGGDGIPEYKRWIIYYETDDIGVYANQLSHFNIDIAVIHQTRNDIWRIHDVGGGGSVIKTNRERENMTLRFTHVKIKMKRWDQTLCKRLGVDLASTVQAQFYPEETRVIIRGVEAAALEGTGRTLNQVKNTILKVVPGGNGFEFIVVEILYR